jgi:hypothetical protein
MAHAHSLSEWAQMLSLATSAYAGVSVFYFLLVDADLADFDPRPAVRRAHQVAVYAGHDLNRAYASVEHAARPLLAAAVHALRTLPRDAGLTLAALYVLTIPGSTR